MLAFVKLQDKVAAKCKVFYRILPAEKNKQCPLQFVMYHENKTSTTCTTSIHAWKKCGIYPSHSREILLLEGNICNLRGKLSFRWIFLSFSSINF